MGDEHTYTTQRHEFAVYAQRAGRFRVPSFTVRFGVVEGIMETRVLELPTPTVEFEARMPPGAERYTSLVATRSFTVTETWDPPPGSARVGDAFRRTITRRAADVPGMFFPPIPFGEFEHLGVYARPAAVNDRSQRGDVAGERVEEVTYVCESAGEVELPALELVWWNLETETLEREVLSSVRLEIAENPAHAGEVTVVEDSEPTARSPWTLVIPVGLIGVAVLLVLNLEPLRRRWMLRRQQRESSERHAFRQLIRACRSGTPAEVLSRIYSWLSRLEGPTRTPTLGDLLEGQEDEGVGRAFAALESACVGVGTLQREELERALKRARSGRLTRRRESRSSLARLNPGATTVD